jgi:hypothetical protein
MFTCINCPVLKFLNDRIFWIFSACKTQICDVDSLPFLIYFQILCKKSNIKDLKLKTVSNLKKVLNVIYTNKRPLEKALRKKRSWSVKWKLHWILLGTDVAIFRRTNQNVCTRVGEEDTFMFCNLRDFFKRKTK